MLYLTRLILDPGHPEVRKLLSNPYLVHQRILNAWGDTKPGRVLYRLEEPAGDPLYRGRRPPRLLVQAPEAGDWDAAFGPAELREMEQKAVALSLRQGLTLRFFLRANPTRRAPAGNALRSDGTPKDGPRHPLYREDEQREWVRRKGEQSGFEVLVVDLFDRGQVVAHRPRQGAAGVRMRHHCVDFVGRLRVTDGERLAEAVAEGIGSAKGFGFGLLSLARAEP